MRAMFLMFCLAACSNNHAHTDGSVDAATAVHDASFQHKHHHPLDAAISIADAAPSPTDGSPAPSDGSLAPTDSATPASATIFPATSPWYKDSTSASTAADSGAIISHLSSWGTLNLDPSFDVMHADNSVTRRAYQKNTDYYYSPDCDFAPVPLVPGGAIENYPLNGYTCGGGDCHLIVYQGTRLYELYVTNIQGGSYNGSPFTGGCLAIWDTSKDVWQPGSSPYARGDQCTSADAAGFPIAPLLLTADDLTSGEIKHALRFTLPNSLIRASAYVRPATHGTSPPGGASGGSNTMPYGAHLRLKPGSYASIGAKGQIVVKALQKYGMYMADGGNLFLSGTADLQNVSGFSTSMLSSLKASDFEVLDSGSPIALTYDCNRTPITN